MTTAATIASDVIASEADAAVASSAATTAVLAADIAIASAQQQTAQVMVIAAEQIGEAEASLEFTKEEISWLKRISQTLEAQNLATMEKVSSLEAQILEILTLVASPSPTPQTPAAEAPETPPQVATDPQSAVAAAPAEAPAENLPPAKRRLRRL